jgi:putative transposase
LTHHLDYPKHSSSKYDNARNGKMEIVSPRDRNGSFEPELVKKRQTRFDVFDDKILSMCACGMKVREIQEHLEEVFAVEVSPLEL